MSAPSLVPLYARAVLSARRKSAGAAAAAQAGRPLVVPSRAVVLPGVAVDVERAGAFAWVTSLPLRRALSVTGPHLLAFAAQMQVLTDDDFPLPLPGLVHVAQLVRQHRALGVGERVDVRVVARGLLPHPRGAVVALDSRVVSDGELVWEGTSEYLARGASAPDPPVGSAAPGVASVELPAPPERLVAQWRVPVAAGRRYAAVSGDVNPIHLSSVAARGLGFPGAIAHGMWTLARALGQVEPRIGDAVEVRARFGSPLLLGRPATLCVDPVSSPDGGGWALAVRSGAPLPGQRVHLTATARPLR